MLYLVTDAETGTAVLIEAKRSDGAISIAVASRFVASAVTVREAFDLGPQRRCELFGRGQREGWNVWGNEVDKFTLDPQHKEQ